LSSQPDICRGWAPNFNLRHVTDRSRFVFQARIGNCTQIDSRRGEADQWSSRRDRLDKGLSDLAQRIVHSEIRTATAIAELAGDIREMTGVLRNASELRPRVERCEHDIADLRARLDAASR
jgi:hypothetical protein